MQAAYAHFRELLGRQEGATAVEALKPLGYGTQPYFNTSRGDMCYAYKGDEGLPFFSAAELTAMVLTYARDTTKDFGGQSVRP